MFSRHWLVLVQRLLTPVLCALQVPVLTGAVADVLPVVVLMGLGRLLMLSSLRGALAEALRHVDMLLTAGLAACGWLITAYLKTVNKRFDKVDERFNEVDERFNKVDERFDKVDERFNKVDERLTQMDKRFTKRFTKMDKRLVNIDSLLRNALSERRK